MASRKLNPCTPAAMVGYFDELSDAIYKGTDEPDAFSDIGVVARWKYPDRWRKATCRCKAIR
jgi:hypothetical protein